VTRGKAPVDSGVYGVALDVISSQAEIGPDVAEVRRGPVSRDEHPTVLELYFDDDDPRSPNELIVATATLVLVGADLVAAKELGLAVAAGLLLDLVLARVLLMPALARLSQ